MKVLYQLIPFMFTGLPSPPSGMMRVQAIDILHPKIQKQGHAVEVTGQMGTQAAFIRCMNRD